MGESAGAKAGLSKEEVEFHLGYSVGPKTEIATGRDRTFKREGDRWFELGTKPAPFVGGE